MAVLFEIKGEGIVRAGKAVLRGIVGFLMGRHADTLALRPDAPRGIDLYAYKIVPGLYGQFLAYILYRREIIVRESAIFDTLGVRALGCHVDAAISELRLDVAVALIVATRALSTAHPPVTGPAEPACV